MSHVALAPQWLSARQSEMSCTLRIIYGARYDRSRAVSRPVYVARCTLHVVHTLCCCTHSVYPAGSSHDYAEIRPLKARGSITSIGEAEARPASDNSVGSIVYHSIRTADQTGDHRGYSQPPCLQLQGSVQVASRSAPRMIELSPATSLALRASSLWECSMLTYLVSTCGRPLKQGVIDGIWTIRRGIILPLAAAALVSP